jgi:hypothetical protein
LRLDHLRAAAECPSRSSGITIAQICSDATVPKQVRNNVSPLVDSGARYERCGRGGFGASAESRTPSPPGRPTACASHAVWSRGYRLRAFDCDARETIRAPRRRLAGNRPRRFARRRHCAESSSRQRFPAGRSRMSCRNAVHRGGFGGERGQEDASAASRPEHTPCDLRERPSVRRGDGLRTIVRGASLEGDTVPNQVRDTASPLRSRSRCAIAVRQGDFRGELRKTDARSAARPKHTRRDLREQIRARRGDRLRALVRGASVACRRNCADSSASETHGTLS